jgi:hypothetical protein
MILYTDSCRSCLDISEKFEELRPINPNRYPELHLGLLNSEFTVAKRLLKKGDYKWSKASWE